MALLKHYVDSSWATRFSCNGCMIFCVPWSSYSLVLENAEVRRLSRAEAELFGATLAARDAIFVLELLIDLGVNARGPINIFADSKSAVGMAFNPVAFKKPNTFCARLSFCAIRLSAKSSFCRMCRAL